MTEDEFEEMVKQALKDEGIFPPCVLDTHYDYNAEMSKVEIIEKTLREMGMRSISEADPDFGEKTAYIPIVMEEVQRRLPDDTIKTCGAFSDLNVLCCDRCHTLYPQYEMSLIDLPDGSKEWVCCAIKRVIHPQLQERTRNSPREKLLRNIFGGDEEPKE
jgi:hypothetical protein